MAELHAEISGADGPDREADDAGRIEDLLRSLAGTVRNFRLYAGNGPMVERFIEALREKLGALWQDFDRVQLAIAERTMTWEDRHVYPVGDASGELAFLFYKDGIRSITLLPGIEEDLPGLLAMLGRAPQLREDEDDLVTLLWQENLRGLTYECVDLPVDTSGIDAAGGSGPARVDPHAVRAAAQEPNEVPGLSTEDFQDTLYFLDDTELRRLEHEIALEMERDVWRDVLTALLDRLEDGSAERQTRIATLFDEMLPSMLAAGAFDRAATMLDELAQILATADTLTGPVRERVQHVFEQLADPDVLRQLVQMMDEAPHTPQGESLERLLGHFPGQSLAPLTGMIESVMRPDVRRLLETAATRLAAANRQEVVRLLADPDPGVVRGALQWVGDLAIGGAAPEVLRLLRHAEPPIRVAAIGAAVRLRAAIAGPTLIGLLDDPEREVRIAAAKAVGSLADEAARPTLEGAIQGKRLRAADRSEKIAFFEALGRVGGSEAVPYLDRILNGRGWLGRSEAAEMRACAALGLARIAHPSARASLQTAAQDPDPVVRSAVTRSLRGEGS